jgi:hypothetical protein
VDCLLNKLIVEFVVEGRTLLIRTTDDNADGCVDSVAVTVGGTFVLQFMTVCSCIHQLNATVTSNN